MADLFVGFDRLEYPGSGAMQSLYESTNLAFCGFYLAPAPGHVNASWMAPPGEAPLASMGEVLQNQGWGLALIYYGRQTPDVVNPNAGVYDHLDLAGGATDGADAVALAKGAGLSDGVIYLDIETATIDNDMLDYARSWIDTVAAGTFSAGIYSHQNYANQLSADRPECFVWLVKTQVGAKPTFDADGKIVPPGDPSQYGSAVVAWQYVLDWAGPLTYTDETLNTGQLANIDLNVANIINPAFPAGKGLTDKFCGAVSNLTTAEAAILGGDAIHASINSSDPAPWPNGLLVNISGTWAGSENLVAVPQSVRVPAGATQVDVTLATTTTETETEVTLSAAAVYQAGAVSATVTIQASS